MLTLIHQTKKRERGRLWTFLLPLPPTQSLKTHTFLCVKHLRRVWTADALRYSPLLEPVAHRVSTVVKVLCYKWKVAVSIPAGVSGFFIDIKSFRSHYGPGVDSASNRNEYQEYFLGVKAAGA